MEEPALGAEGVDNWVDWWYSWTATGRDGVRRGPAEVGYEEAKDA